MERAASQMVRSQSRTINSKSNTLALINAPGAKVLSPERLRSRQTPVFLFSQADRVCFWFIQELCFPLLPLLFPSLNLDFLRAPAHPLVTFSRKTHCWLGRQFFSRQFFIRIKLICRLFPGAWNILVFLQPLSWSIFNIRNPERYIIGFFRLFLSWLIFILSFLFLPEF